MGSLITPGTFNMVQGGDDIFVAKLDQATGNVIYSARIGSSGTDKGMAVDIDEHGRATVVGWAAQGVTNFPTTPEASDTKPRAIASLRSSSVCAPTAASSSTRPTSS